MVNFSMIYMLVNWLYGGINCSCDGLLQWNLSWKRTCIKRPPKNSLNKQFMLTKCFVACAVLKKMRYPIPKKKRGQVTEHVKSL